MGLDASSEAATHDVTGSRSSELRSAARSAAGARMQRDPFIRAENEDDDGYDPYSDRRPEPEPLFERDPWG